MINTTTMQKQSDRGTSNIQLMLTRRCHLRCSYCPIRKGNEDMPQAVLDRSVDLLLSSNSDSLRLDFTGGEPLLRFDLVKRAMERAKRLSGRRHKKISFYIVTNAIALIQEMVSYLGANDVQFELSLDGDKSTHNRFKIVHSGGLDPYKKTTEALNLILKSKIKYVAIMVVTPSTLGAMRQNFEHLLSLGISTVDINYALGAIWDNKSIARFFKELGMLCVDHSGSLKSGKLELGNLGRRSEPALLNTEIMIDTDGSIHSMSEWLFESAAASRRPPFPMGDVFRLNSLDSICLGRFHSYYTLMKMYGHIPKIRRVVLNNVNMGVLTSRFLEKLKGDLLS